jgi:hypothetical protein
MSRNGWKVLVADRDGSGLATKARHLRLKVIQANDRVP